MYIREYSRIDMVHALKCAYSHFNMLFCYRYRLLIEIAASDLTWVLRVVHDAYNCSES